MNSHTTLSSHHKIGAWSRDNMCPSGWVGPELGTRGWGLSIRLEGGTDRLEKD